MENIGSTINRILLLLGIVLAVTVWLKHTDLQNRKLRDDYRRGLASGAGNCQGKNFCVVIYIAPWCPYCKKLRPQILAALEKSKTMRDYGVKVVVGQGSAAQNEAEAASYGSGAQTDQGNSVRKALDVHGYPAFFVLDKEQTVILREQEARQWVEEKFSL